MGMNQQRLTQVILAPIVSEKATYWLKNVTK
ncbi:50S ribosomal protein L23 [Neisseria meningitidis]|nr:50S ribosomal protein L23 [Neisseria meningitidis]